VGNALFVTLNTADNIPRYQSRAFLLLPMTFNVGVIIGPILGGLLADPAGSYPKLFGSIAWLKKYPYAAPNIVSAFFLLCAVLGIFFGLEEVCKTTSVPVNLSNLTSTRH
jgi:MFS family permease